MKDLIEDPKKDCFVSQESLPTKVDLMTVEVMSLRDVPLYVRHREASKPMYLKRYE